MASIFNQFYGDSANGTLPVYEIKYAGKKMGLFLSRVGALACAAGLEEIIVPAWKMGVPVYKYFHS